ncbi:MAG: phage tail tape measure C-terminal domain-containing protein [Maricaulaceae bacterium]
MTLGLSAPSEPRTAFAFELDLNPAARALEAFSSGPVRKAGEILTETFEIASARLSDALERALRTGELNFAHFGRAIAADMARLALDELVVGPLQRGLTTLLGGLGGQARPRDMGFLGGLAAPPMLSSLGQGDRGWLGSFGRDLLGAAFSVVSPMSGGSLVSGIGSSFVSGLASALAPPSSPTAPVFSNASAGRSGFGSASAPSPEPLVVNFNVSSGVDAREMRRSAGQMAVALARAVDTGRSRL